MGVLDKIRDYITGLEERELYRYVVIGLGTVIFALSLLLFYHYRTVHTLRSRIRRINIMREDDVQEILSKAEYIQKQSQEIDTLLAEDKNFKIVGYFKDVLEKLNLTDKLNSAGRKEIGTPSQIERQDQYRESILDVAFDTMDMKQITELLQELGNNRRIFVKKIEIIRSKKYLGKLEVNMTIGTFLLKSE